MADPARERQSKEIHAITDDPEFVDEVLLARAVGAILADHRQSMAPESIAKKLGISTFQCRLLLHSRRWQAVVLSELRHYTQGLLHRSLICLEGILIDEKARATEKIGAVRAIAAIYGSMIDGQAKAHDAKNAEARTAALLARIRPPKITVVPEKA
jgi:hypothetical protein